MYPDLSTTCGANAGSAEKGFVKGGMAATKGGSAGMTVAAMPMAMPVATAVPMVQGVDSKLNYEAEVARAREEKEEEEAMERAKEDNKELYQTGADGHYQVSEYKSEYETSEYQTSDYQCSDYKSVYEK